MGDLVFEMEYNDGMLKNSKGKVDLTIEELEDTESPQLKLGMCFYHVMAGVKYHVKQEKGPTIVDVGLALHDIKRLSGLTATDFQKAWPAVQKKWIERNWTSFA